jgi:hypothetical protein
MVVVAKQKNLNKKSISMINLIKTQASDNSFSANGGLLFARRLLDRLGLAAKLAPLLPSTKRNTQSGMHKFENLVLGFLAGNDHLDDWDVLAEDPGFAAVSPRTYCAKALGDYLRAFSGQALHSLQGKLIETSLSLRLKLGADASCFILDLDSTLHAQYGKKTEGVEFCYKNFMALDSILAFDELGFQYWHEVRPGATYTSNGCGQIIHEVFSRMARPTRHQRYIARADSGFFTSEFFNSCSVKSVGFVCAAKKTDGVKNHISRIKNWQAQDVHDPQRIFAKGGRECELGSISYHTDGYKGSLRLVVIRAKKPKEEGVIFEDYAEYDYFPFVTNMGAHEYDNTALIKLYRGRGNAENFIKEQKYGFDLKHYPCLKLRANKAFGLIAAFTYTLTRFLSLSSPTSKKTAEGIKKINHFAKKIRNRWLLIPAQVIRHAGSVIFRFNRRHHKEIVYWEEKLKNMQFEYSS